MFATSTAKFPTVLQWGEEEERDGRWATLTAVSDAERSRGSLQMPGSSTPQLNKRQYLIRDSRTWL